MPSRSLLIKTWHPNRDVSVNPNARSNISFSSSEGSSILSNISGSSTITWQVEQAQDPPQAPIFKIQLAYPCFVDNMPSDLDIPSISRSFACAMSSRLSPSDTCNSTFVPSLSMNVTLILSTWLEPKSLGRNADVLLLAGLRRRDVTVGGLRCAGERSLCQIPPLRSFPETVLCTSIPATCVRDSPGTPRHGRVADVSPGLSQAGVSDFGHSLAHLLAKSSPERHCLEGSLTRREKWTGIREEKKCLRRVEE